MCDICGDKDHFDKFKKRVDQIVDTVKRSNPDIISFQEFRTKRQLLKINKRLGKQYEVLYSDGLILNYADPALFIRKDRFEVIKHYSFWLGPRGGRFSFGWRFGIPRKLRYSVLKDKVSGLEFAFVGSHFDNSKKNKYPSAIMVNEHLIKKNLPIIFAADTNLKPDMEGLEFLKKDLFEDTFYKVDSVNYLANTPYSIHDACNIEKDTVFPDCRVDHVLLSKGSPFSVKKWSVDVYRYGNRKVFVSDHRAIIVDLEID
tara:strand:+ start:106 stop:879 length:774 start_codon:yes stop_codon:yes gene_type:complete